MTHVGVAGETEGDGSGAVVLRETTYCALPRQGGRGAGGGRCRYVLSGKERKGRKLVLSVASVQASNLLEQSTPQAAFSQNDRMQQTVNFTLTVALTM